MKMKNKLKGLLTTFALAGTIFVGMPAEETYAVNQCYITITTNNTGSNAAIGTGPCYQKGYYNGSGFVVVGDYTGPVTNGEVVDLFASGGDGGNNSGPAQLHITTVSAPAPQPEPAPEPKPAPAPTPQPKPEPKPVNPAPTPEPSKPVKPTPAPVPKQEQPTVPKKEVAVTSPSTPSSSSASKTNTGEKVKQTDGATAQVESSTKEESKPEQKQENEVANPYTVAQLKDKNAKVVEKDGKLFATFEEDGQVKEQEISEGESEIISDEPKEEKKKENKNERKKETKDEKVLNTDTNVGIIILIGMILVAVGGVIVVIVRKRRVKEN